MATTLRDPYTDEELETDPVGNQSSTGFRLSKSGKAEENFVKTQAQERLNTQGGYNEPAIYEE